MELSKAEIERESEVIDKIWWFMLRLKNEKKHENSTLKRKIWKAEKASDIQIGKSKNNQFIHNFPFLFEP